MTIRCPHCGHEIAPPKSSGLTPRQTDALSFITSYIAEHGISPAFSDIEKALDLHSKSSVHRLVAALERSGAIRRDRGVGRSIQLVEAA